MSQKKPSPGSSSHGEKSTIHSTRQKNKKGLNPEPADVNSDQKETHQLREEILEMQERFQNSFNEQAATLESSKQQTEKLRVTDRRKTDFMSMLGHELRNPLAAIRNSISMLIRLQSSGKKGEHYQAKTDKALAILERQAQLMTRLVNDLLDVTRVNENKIHLIRQPVALAETIEAATSALQGEIDARQIKLTIALPDKPLYLHADNERFLQIMDNLLSNAIKSTGTGGKIELKAMPENEHALIRIKDDGIGIPKDFIDHVFDQFPHSQQTGLGLGLSLVKSLVAMHGGSITAHSDGPDKGTEFSLRLPLSKTGPGKSMDSQLTGTAETLRMLVVDDNADVANGLAMLLRTQNHEVEIVLTAEEAYTAAVRTRPQVALVDLSMPGTDGYKLAQRLRRKFPTNSLVLIAVSGHPEDERVRAAGFDYHLLKPVTLRAINEVLTLLTVSI
ncbi:MAG TPA: hybrid sensor histidine kinase/response regulator [Gammaproteobacteria bacterium]